MGLKNKEHYVWLVCQECTPSGKGRYTTWKKLKAAYKLEKKKYCRFCRKHTVHKEKKL